jgi:tetratricopeptide (TPR) repeat protein
MADKNDRSEIDSDVVREGAERIQGVFSAQAMVKSGSGTSQRRAIQKTYWSGFELSDGRIEIQPLNSRYIPAGPKQILSRDEFLAKYSPEPEFYMSTVYPAMTEGVGDSRAEGQRAQGDSEFEHKRSALVDEDNVRANFGLGLTYLDRGDQRKANDIFERIVALDAAFQEEHKHLFNDFGINMRKNKMFDQALRYYLRAAELVEDDEHLFHNIARCYYEKGDVKECKTYLKKSLRMNRHLRESQLFWEFLRKRGYVGENETPMTR